MVTKYQKFADGYKAEAVKLYRESNQTIAETAQISGKRCAWGVKGRVRG